MTRDEAIEVVHMILNSWTRPTWTDGQTETYVNALVPYDAELATNAVALAHKELSFRPSFNEFVQFYKAARAHADAKTRQPHTTGGKTNTMPLWVKRWVCARFLAGRFGRAPDHRVFPEQRDWHNPDDPLMPIDEWVDEANRITDRDALHAFAQASKP